MFLIGRRNKRRHFAMCFNNDGGGAGEGSAGNEGGGGGSSRAGMVGAGAGTDSGDNNGGSDGASTFAIPEQFKNDPDFKDVKDWDGFSKKVSGYKTLAGKKAVPEYGKATDQDWEDFFSRTRPVDGKYALNEEGIFEKFRGNQEFTKGLEGVFNKAGLTQKQVDILMDPKDGYSGYMLAEISKINGQIQAKEAETDAQFDGLAVKVFGDRKDEAIGNAVQLLTEASEGLGLEDGLDKMIAENPDALVGLAQRLDYIHSTYISDDTLDKRRSGGGGTNSNDPAALQAALSKYKTDNWSVYSDPNHARYPEVMKNVQSMTDQLMKVSSIK